METTPIRISIQKQVVRGEDTAGVVVAAIIGEDFVQIANQDIKSMQTSKTEWAAVRKVSSAHDWWEEQIIG